MANQKTIVLPNREVMLARLRKMSATPFMEQRFYSLLLRHAGGEKVAVGIIMMIFDALFELDKIPGSVSSRIFKFMMFDLVDALVDDEEVKNAAKLLALAAQNYGSYRLAQQALMEGFFSDRYGSPFSRAQLPLNGRSRCRL
jgi:hypothetical protein